MGADGRTERSDGPDSGSDARWERLWRHREDLLKVARRRSMSFEDAEDAVHEAMVRAMENPQVEDDRLGAWLTTVTMRLCVDRYRQVSREAQARGRSALAPASPAPVEEAVCDRAEARWLARRSEELPARQAQALSLKSEDLDIEQVARRMGVSYRSAEGLLARARQALRTSLAETLGLAVWLLRPWRPRPQGAGQAVAVMSTAAALAVLGVTLPAVHQPPGTRPDVSATPLRPGRTHPADQTSAGRLGAAPHAGAAHLFVPSAVACPTAASVPAAGVLPGAPGLPGIAAPVVPSFSAPALPPVLPSFPATRPPASATVPSLPAIPPAVPVSGAVPSALPTGIHP